MTNHQNSIMTKTELIKKLSDIEWEDFEVKESKSELPKNIWETVSAFSNTAGGWIVLGVKQKGKTYEIVGVGSPDKIEQDFTNTLRGEKFNAKLLPLCKKYQFDEKVVLAFFIPVSSKNQFIIITLPTHFYGQPVVINVRAKKR